MPYKIQILEKENWSPLLKQIGDSPKQLYYAGSIPDYSQKFLCVVGSRKYTDYGREAVSSIISELRGYPITIVSGLALGIDSIAHKMAIKNNLKTIAVPGSGLAPKALHPATNINLAEEIVESGGTLISEYEPEFKATQWSFPLRNRIMAGMCNATLIIEAEERSGTMITAKLTTEYNRELLAIPGSIFSPMSLGPNMFIRLGATLIRDGEDVLEALGFGKLDLDNKKDKSKTEENKNISEYKDCSPKELLILNLLKTPLEKDELVRQAVAKELSVSEVQTLITLLELKGYIKESLGEIGLILQFLYLSLILNLLFIFAFK